jgi:opacity protein-like surface antigen
MLDSRVPGARFLALAAAPLLLAVSAADAQRPDFLFHEPTGTISLYGGWAVPGERSDLFDFVREELTIERGDFNAPVIGAELSLRLMRHLDAALGIEHSRAERHSELREWLEDGRPITQTTEFGWTRAMASARVYLLDRGRSFGSHAWVPTRWSPFVGGGGGFVWYTFEQFGDFIDYETVDDPEGAVIFTDRFRSRGGGGSAHALAGLDISLTPRVVLRGEYRYHWGSARLDSRDFVGFEPIDLSAHRATIGIATRF